ncbi:MAG TPA: hypothetical protein PK478_10105, partial [Nitrospira sp.]|nr:hypothetical protein [Nitrospira sp.]HQW90195.1 hypothetical protein [Nitrospira sp.]
SAMQHVALFTPWLPAQNADSGQMENAADVWGSTPCGVDYSAKGQLIEDSEGTFVAHYRLRLPLDMAARARPLSQYRITTAFGATAEKPLVLEQVSEPAAGPSGIVVWARNVP